MTVSTATRLVYSPDIFRKKRRLPKLEAADDPLVVVTIELFILACNWLGGALSVSKRSISHYTSRIFLAVAQPRPANSHFVGKKRPTFCLKRDNLSNYDWVNNLCNG